MAVNQQRDVTTYLKCTVYSLQKSLLCRTCLISCSVIGILIANVIMI